MTSTRYHPWRELRARELIGVVWPVLPGHVKGMTDGISKIELNRRLDQVGRRCTLVHELVHIDFGHCCEQPPAIERMVRIETARRLIPVVLLGDALAYSLDLDEVAFDIWVTRSVLDDRLSELTDVETLYLQGRTVHHRGEEL